MTKAGFDDKGRFIHHCDHPGCEAREKKPSARPGAAAPRQGRLFQ